MRLCCYLILPLLVADPCSADDPNGPVYPLDAAVADDEGTYVVDRRLPGVWRSDEMGMTIHVRGSQRYREQMNAPWCVAIDADGRLLVGDSATRDVYRIDAERNATSVTSTGDGKPGVIGIPIDMAVDSKGTIYVADLESHRIWTLPKAGGTPEEFAVVRAPRGLTIDDDDRLWVVTHGNDQLLRFDANGKPEVVVKGRPFRFPNAVVVTADGTAYVTDGYAKAVWRVPAGSGAKPERLIEGEPLVKPCGLARGGDHLLVVDPGSGVHRFTTDGEFVETLPGSGVSRSEKTE